MPFVIVDIDGCVSNDAHRRWLSGQQEFDKYHDKAFLDKPNFYIVSLLVSLPYDIVMLTGREERMRAQTLLWFDHFKVPCHKLIMRPADCRAMRSYEFKRDAFERYLKENNLHYSDCVLAIEDMPPVIKMWKSYGIPVLQVHQKENL